MDTVQNQILALNHKVDGLYDTIERLNLKLSNVLERSPSQLESSPDFEDCQPLSPNLKSDRHSELHLFMEHKDVLGDESRREIGNASMETEIAPEVQIQRLTAQLTAAYNRIAALEEQLLSRTDSARRNGQQARVRRD
jgi:hypothetical protein